MSAVLEELEHPLSARQLEVLQRAGDGERIEDIANALHLAPSTIKAHMTTARVKLGARNTTHAVSLALRRGELE